MGGLGMEAAAGRADSRLVAHSDHCYLGAYLVRGAGWPRQASLAKHVISYNSRLEFKNHQRAPAARRHRARECHTCSHIAAHTKRDTERASCHKPAKINTIQTAN